MWDLRVQPKRLVVLGGGPIGSELAQAFARLGSKVTQVEMLPRIMAKEDPEFSEMVAIGHYLYNIEETKHRQGWGVYIDCRVFRLGGMGREWQGRDRGGGTLQQ